ncbi:MAG: tRNA-dihydrouridine synthase family protein [Clostridia bacterium]|nr:tRNA-dihydrouridine synthase family protein [Clostridia bacterium]
MNLYFAPLEGITTYTFRNTHRELFGLCDEYYAPFIVPTDNEKISLKTLRDISPEKNIQNPKVQVMCTTASAFCEFSKKIKTIGYNEVNLNLGCPSGTVVKKSRGSGALKDTDSLDRFFDGIFSGTDIKITVKTRAGFYSHDEFESLMNIYNKYPIKELIVHPRVREEYYKGEPNMESFDKAYYKTNTKLCYNGNIYFVSDYLNLCNKYKNLNSVMIGRGAVRNPAIFREIKGGEPLKTEELIRFSKLLEERYFALLDSDRYTLHRLKEIWIYAMDNYKDEKKILKAVKKSSKLSELNSAIENLPYLK